MTATATPPSSGARSRTRRNGGVLRIGPVPVPAGAKHPTVPHAEVLLQHPFSLGIIAPKGHGKTTFIVNQLLFYRGYFHTIIVFSPTLENDEKWDYVREQPLRAENRALQHFMDTKTLARDHIVRPPRPPVGAEKQFDPRIPADCFIREYNEDTLLHILNEQDALVDKIKELGGTVHLANRLLFIFDDLVGSSLFNNRRDNVFKMLNTRMRHFNASIMMVSQGYREIPKTVRTNWSGLILFDISSDGELASIREEYPMKLKRDQWQETYDYCTHDDYGFLYYNTQRKNKRLRIMHNYDEVVFVA